MTPKEKAKELVNKMIIDFIDWTYFIPIDKTNNSTIQTEAKRRALIAVDEMIDFEKRIINQLHKITKNAGGEFKVENEFWIQVKEEIEKL